MLELQYHPADVSRSPRFFFLSPARVRVLLCAIVAVAVALFAGVPLVPRALSGLAVWVGVKRLQREQASLQAHLRRLQQQEASLRSQLEARAAGLRRVALVLGLEPADWEPPTTPEKAAARSRELLAEADRLALWAQEHSKLVAALPAVSPLPHGAFQVTSLFGPRISPFTGSYELHKGLDLAAPEGQPVQATGAGVVVFAGRVGLNNLPWARLGNVVVLKHAGLYLTIYAHLKQVHVREGQQVQRGEVVGEVGATGWATAPHLHYEVRKLVEGERAMPVDPRFFMLDVPWERENRAVGGQGDMVLDLLPEEKENLPWLKTKRFPR